MVSSSPVSALYVLNQAQQAQAQIRRAINRESVAAAKGASSEQKRQQVQARLDQTGAKFYDAARQIHALRAKLKEMGEPV